MLPLEAIRLDRFAIHGTIWLATAVAWAAACIWVERDARDTFGRSLPWRSLFAVVGAVLFLGTYQFGAALVPWGAGMVACATGAYVIIRDSLVAADQRLVPFVAVSDAISRMLRKTGLEDRLQQLVGRGGVAVLLPIGGPSVTVVKKDGSVCAGDGPRVEDSGQSQAILAAHRMLGDVVAKRATEMHLEPKTAQEAQARYRIDGVMHTMHVLPGEAGQAVVGGLKALAGMDMAASRGPQDGTFAVLADGHKFDVRAASGPTRFGDKIALRLLDAGGGILKGGLAGLGMRDALVQSLRSIIQRGHGMLIVCGPTGSGRTTTAYAALGEIDVLTRSVVTIEDSIVYRLDNVSQSAVNKAAGLTFVKLLRSSLRQDPDVVLVGEVQDKETAEIAMQAARTGHFVIATLQSTDTATTVARLVESGIDPGLIQSAVTAVLAQRLVRLLCPKCKKGYQPPPELLRRLGLPADKVPTLYKEVGCRACHGTGFHGQTGIYELLECDGDVRSLLGGRPSAEEIRGAARKKGMRTLKQAALAKVFEGVTSIGEAERVTR